FFFSSRRRHTRSTRDWSSDVCSSDLRVRGDADRVVELYRLLDGNAQTLRGELRRRRRDLPASSCRLVRPREELDDLEVRGEPLRSEERRVGKGERSGWSASRERCERE